MMVKTAVFAPMPRAKHDAATMVNPGVLIRIRDA